jgi:hypothetical protein
VDDDLDVDAVAKGVVEVAAIANKLYQ